MSLAPPPSSAFNFLRQGDGSPPRTVKLEEFLMSPPTIQFLRLAFVQIWTLWSLKMVHVCSTCFLTSYISVVDFFNRINLLYGTIFEHCTEQTCPTMSGGTKYEYHWCDGVNYKKPTALPAPQYITLLMEWVETQINDEHLFPIQVGKPFPKSYLSVVKKILKRLFRVFVHVYIHHFDKLLAIGAEAHVNTCYKHFYYFVTEYNLIDKKELEPLRDMTERICH